ncbi:Similar to neur: Protein neuralized (Drosophila melanogaster) [Cotesia congregata]|uniref:Protein neuralized n=1 Tax=Cotesia congregata TaxID=51543 RepID=A0A8J2EDE8_COTCN|nr:Similar to neur: Protein neuralized (Drosophila melanogaster) [Cotesia congregata]
MGVVGGECAVKGTGVKSHPCHCCGSTRISTTVGPSVVIQVHKHRRSSRKSQSNLNNNHINHHQDNSLVFVQEPEVPPTNSPTTTSTDNILAPLKSKMKVLKKLKRKMGLAPRSSNTGTNNLPPLTFHQVHGENIRLCNGATIARRHESFCKGITFSARPVRVGEKVCVKFLEMSNNWSGVIRFGFTSNDPVHLRNGLPRYACPDLTNKPGYWAKALAERFAGRDTVLFYYVTAAGDVHFGVNGEEKGVFFSGVETRGPLWAVIDVYGNSTAIEFLDPNRQHFNNIRRGVEHSNEDNAQPSRHTAMDDASNAGRDIVEKIIVPTMQNMVLHHGPEPDVDLPGLRFQPSGVLFAPLPFHPVRGRNIRFSNQQCVATRNDTEFCHGYAFTNRPLILGERLVVQILSTEPMYVGALALGLTSCDPARLTAEDLPDDSDLLLDRPEYWVVSKDVASSPQPGDEIAFTVTHYGEVQMSKNGGPPNIVMHVDQSLQLWAFVDVYGSTQRVRMLASRPSSPPRQRQATAVAPSNPVSVPVAPTTPAATHPATPQPLVTPHQNHQGHVTELTRYPDMVQVKSGIGGQTVLVVNLPPQQNYPPASPPIYGSTNRSPGFYPSGSSTGPTGSTGSTGGNPVAASTPRASPPVLTGTMSSTGSSTYVDPVTYQAIDSSTLTLQGTGNPHLQQWSEKLQPTPGQPSECSICYERNIDSVLYMCGHMCMCYPCAIQQWRGKGGGQCPLCRAQIRDVIRIYRS